MADATEQRAKRRRASAPKKRTGCGTCKIRHKRCDEAKPICDTCRKAGVICDGYVDPSTGQKFGGNAPSISPRSSLAPRTLFANDEEAQGFQFFETATDVQLAAALQYNGWTSPFLQLSHQDPAICHAVIATGITSRRYQANELSTPRDSQSNSLYHAALQQYGKAVASFRSQLGASLEGNPPSTENALACCVLLIMFEFLQGNAAGLLLHLRSATRLAASVGSSPRAQPFINLLVLIDMVAAVWLNLDRFHFDASPHLPKLNTSRVPLTTHSDLKTLGYDLIHIKNDVTIWRHAVASAHSEITAYSFSTVNRQTIQSRLEFWHRQFISVCPNEEDIATHRRSILRANYLLIMLIVDAVHDPQLPAQSTQAGSVSGLGPLKLKYLHDIIELAEGVLKTGYSFRRYDASAGEEPLMGTGLLPLFSFRHSFIQPLFYVAQNGPDMRLRQKAIQLLIEKPWREGAWDSFIMGSIAKRSLDASA